MKARVTELKGKAAAKTVVTAESLIERAEKVYQGSYEAKQYNAANGAIREMGVLTSHRIERSEVGAPGAFDDLNDDALERVMEEKLGALGYAIEVLPDTDAESDTQH